MPGDVLLRESRAFRRCVSEMGRKSISVSQVSAEARGSAYKDEATDGQQHGSLSVCSG